MEGWDLWWEGFKERYLLSLEWNRVGVMDNDSGDDGYTIHQMSLDNSVEKSEKWNDQD